MDLNELKVSCQTKHTLCLQKAKQSDGVCFCFHLCSLHFGSFMYLLFLLILLFLFFFLLLLFIYYYYYLLYFQYNLYHYYLLLLFIIIYYNLSFLLRICYYLFCDT